MCRTCRFEPLKHGVCPTWAGAELVPEVSPLAARRPAAAAAASPEQVARRRQARTRRACGPGPEQVDTGIGQRPSRSGVATTPAGSSLGTFSTALITATATTPFGPAAVPDHFAVQGRCLGGDGGGVDRQRRLVPGPGLVVSEYPTLAAANGRSGRPGAHDIQPVPRRRESGQGEVARTGCGRPLDPVGRGVERGGRAVRVRHAGGGGQGVQGAGRAHRVGVAETRVGIAALPADAGVAQAQSGVAGSDVHPQIPVGALTADDHTTDGGGHDGESRHRRHHPVLAAPAAPSHHARQIAGGHGDPGRLAVQLVFQQAVKVVHKVSSGRRWARRVARRRVARWRRLLTVPTGVESAMAVSASDQPRR